jgi:hypothetical protein
MREHLLGQIEHSEFTRVPDVNRPGEIIRRVHGADHGFDQVVDVAEAPGLGPIAVDGDVLAFECLHDEV